MNEIKILGIVGSLRKNSYNHFALKAAQELQRRNTIIRLPACSRTPSTGHQGPMAKVPGQANRRR